jgi:hypothetical protein
MITVQRMHHASCIMREITPHCLVDIWKLTHACALDTKNSGTEEITRR